MRDLIVGFHEDWLMTSTACACHRINEIAPPDFAYL
jgi:hypothetical protein